MFSGHLTESQKSAIADVAIASAELEATLQHFIADLCGLQWPHACVLLANIRLEAKITVIHQLVQCDLKEEEALASFHFVNANLQDLNAQRNTIIHGQWVPRSWPPSRLAVPKMATDVGHGDLMAFATRNGKPPRTVSVRKIKKVADLISLNLHLLTLLLCKHFPDRVTRMVAVVAPESSARVQEIIRKRSQAPQ